MKIREKLSRSVEGSPERRSRLAFRSLLIIMGSTAATMLIVGPAMLSLADPTRGEVSVFTQTMDALLPAPLAYLGTLIGVAVLLSAGATALQGVVHLGHGLSHRHYIPVWLGEGNRNGIADRMVWTFVGLITICLAMFGTHEGIYLALYAAGVFVLLSMTGWAAAKRLWLGRRREATTDWIPQRTGVAVASVLTSTATVVIFKERFREGV